MPIRPRLVEGLIASAAIVLFLSCSDDRRTPLQPPPASSPTATAFVVRIEVVAPPEIEPGESVQLTANAIKSDGSVENITAQARWNPATSTVIDVSASGVATGKTRGEVTVNAQYSARTGIARILVIPKGTFKLTGSIREADIPIAGVTVTVVSGVGQGITVTSGFSGSYVLYGVSGPIRLETKRDGYLTSIHEVNVTAHGSRDLTIVPSMGRSNYTGEYELRFSMTYPCRVGFGTIPEVARQRTYTATVAQDGPRLTVTLRDASFVVVNGHGRGFSGFIDAAGPIRFQLGDVVYYYYYYDGNFDIAESIGDFTLLFSGTLNMQGTPARLTGSFEGLISTSRNASKPFWPFLARCTGTTHTFEMIRR